MSTAPHFITYVPKEFRPPALGVIEQANEILEDYAADGYDLTLRQVYYQFVARGLIANKDTEYKRLGGILSDARLAGLVPWNRLVDRTRNLRGTYHVDDVGQAVSETARDFAVDLWADQTTRCEVWVEKDALVGVVGRAADALDVNYFSCRGYTSQSELWGAAMRHVSYLRDGQDVVVIHLGDHDPSGIDMTRDITDRLYLFASAHVNSPSRIRVQRIALNYDQVEQYSPPPNPAKLTDSRSTGYIAAHGYESWELDALEPRVMDALIQDAIMAHLDWGLFESARDRMESERDRLQEVSNRWPEVAAMLDAPDAP